MATQGFLIVIALCALVACGFMAFLLSGAVASAAKKRQWGVVAIIIAIVAAVALKNTLWAS